MILKFSGEGYGFTNEKYEVLVDMNHSFSVEHEEDMTTIHYNEGFVTLKRDSFKCEGFDLNSSNYQIESSDDRLPEIDLDINVHSRKKIFEHLTSLAKRNW